MHTLMVLYGRPADPDAFRTYYQAPTCRLRANSRASARSATP